MRYCGYSIKLLIFAVLMKCLYWSDVGFKNFCILCGVSMHSDLKQNTNLIKSDNLHAPHTHMRAHTQKHWRDSCKTTCLKGRIILSDTIKIVIFMVLKVLILQQMQRKHT